ncbi:hypothetical protein [Phenylobacterium immobile]|uniref:hypothetical protein n=1 Tax=Phenylobacterium immobile TaxID=21 RepID=UPI000B2C104D|nr:hypothetical protein [Phenylobacterium immobile]
MLRLCLPVIAALALVGPALAQEHRAQDHAAHGAPACAAVDVAAPAGWSRRVELTAATEDGGASAAMLGLGQSAKARLTSGAEVVFPVAPQKTPAGETYAGLFELNVPVAGTYRLSLSEPAWVDVVENGLLIEAAAHAHGPPCGTVRKMVDFPLKAGRHVVEIAGAPKPDIVIMAAPAS